MEIPGELVSNGFTWWADAEKARQFMYADCDASDVEAAIERLGPKHGLP